MLLFSFSFEAGAYKGRQANKNNQPSLSWQSWPSAAGPPASPAPGSPRPASRSLPPDPPRTDSDPASASTVTLASFGAPALAAPSACAPRPIVIDARTIEKKQARKKERNAKNTRVVAHPLLLILQLRPHQLPLHVAFLHDAERVVLVVIPHLLAARACPNSIAPSPCMRVQARTQTPQEREREIDR